MFDSSFYCGRRLVSFFRGSKLPNAEGDIKPDIRVRHDPYAFFSDPINAEKFSDSIRHHFFEVPTKQIFGFFIMNCNVNNVEDPVFVGYDYESGKVWYQYAEFCFDPVSGSVHPLSWAPDPTFSLTPEDVTNGFPGKGVGFLT